MATYRDFADWAGGQAKAGRLIGVNKYRAHRLYHGSAALKPEEAMQIELASGGAFRKEVLMFGPLIKRDENVLGDTH